MRVPLLASSGGGIKGISTNVSSMECINFYYEQPMDGESHQGALLPTNGNILAATVTNTKAIRGMLFNQLDNNLYVVADDDFYEIDSTNGNVTDRGDITSAAGQLLAMAFNPNTSEIFIVDTSDGFIFDCDTNTFTTISDGDFPTTGITTCCYINGRFLVNKLATNGRFQWSNLNDGLTWDAADLATCESMTSPIRAMEEFGGLVYFLGDENGEIWYNQGDGEFIFSRYAHLKHGIWGPLSLKRFDNSLVWLSRDKSGTFRVVRLRGLNEVEVISTPQVSTMMANAANALAFYPRAYVLTYLGHEFYIITVGESMTLAYDASTKMWHQRSGTFSGDEPIDEPIFGAVQGTASGISGSAGVIFLGSSEDDGKIYKLSGTGNYTFGGSTGTNGTAMNRRVTGPAICAENEAVIRFSEVQLDTEEGGGDTSSTVSLSYSKDGGHTWVAKSLALDTSGSSPDYDRRLIRRKFGKGHNWIFRVASTTTGKIVIKGLYGRLYGEDKLGPSKVK
jgi:hypothetical protein